MPTPQEQSFEYLASRFPKRYGVKGTEYLRALLLALAEGDGFISTQVESVRDNLISVTANGKYLDQRAGLYGIVRGQGTGVLDPDFQKLIPLMGMSPKQITEIMLKLIDTIYGPYASHANTTAELEEPYNLEPGWKLIVRVDDTQKTIEFEATDAANLSAATAEELGRAISQKSDGKLIGSVIFDARTGHRYLNIRSSTIGSQGFVQVLGGDAQSALRFPEIRPVTTTLATYNVSRYLGTDEMVFTLASGVGMDLKAAGVSRGDYVTIRSDSGFDLKNTGTFQVSFISGTDFRVINGVGVPESGITNLHLDDFSFFKPDLGNVLLSARPAAIVETSPRELTIILPVTSPVVKRTLKGGHHFHQGLTTIESSTATSVTLSNTTGFDVNGGAFCPTQARSLSKGIVSSIGATTVSLLNATGWPTQGAIYSNSVQQFFYYQGIVGNVLQNVTPTPPVDLVGNNVDYVNRYSYTAATTDTLTGVFPDPTVLGLNEIVAAGANVFAKFPGSFMYDPTAKFTCSSIATNINETVDQGSNKTLLQVDDCTDFPDSGFFVLEFGTNKEEGPIKFLTKVGTQALIIDPGHVFKYDHLDGCKLRVIRSIGPYSPRISGKDYAVYHTSTSPARDLLKQYLQIVAASGVSLRFIIETPKYKWDVLPNLFTSDPLSTTL